MESAPATQPSGPDYVQLPNVSHQLQVLVIGLCPGPQVEQVLPTVLHLQAETSSHHLIPSSCLVFHAGHCELVVGLQDDPVDSDGSFISFLSVTKLVIKQNKFKDSLKSLYCGTNHI